VAAPGGLTAIKLGANGAAGGAAMRGNQRAQWRGAPPPAATGGASAPSVVSTSAAALIAALLCLLPVTLLMLFPGALLARL
jgi:hypothetical protein